jgi:hypothetical protein
LEPRLYRLPFPRNKLLPVFRDFTDFRRTAGIFLSKRHLERRLYHLPFSRNKLLPVFENFSVATKSGYFSEQKALGTTSLSLTVLEKQTTSGFENFSISTKSEYFSEQKALGTTFLSLTVLEKQTTSGFGKFLDFDEKRVFF